MLDFRPPALSDRALVERYVSGSDRIGCDVSFANTYLWRGRYDIRIAFEGDSYYKAYFKDGRPVGYALPMTTGGIEPALERLLSDARERGVRPVIGLLDDHSVELIRRLYGDQATITPDRDSFDYIYEREHLADLAGKKYHAKRNHISRFLRSYDHYSSEEICFANSADALAVAERWQADNADTGELGIIRDALAHFDDLGLFGLILYVDGRPVAMCLASHISDTVCDVHFEKAVEIDEAYAMNEHPRCKH